MKGLELGTLAPREAVGATPTIVIVTGGVVREHTIPEISSSADLLAASGPSVIDLRRLMDPMDIITLGAAGSLVLMGIGLAVGMYGEPIKRAVEAIISR